MMILGFDKDDDDDDNKEDVKTDQLVSM